MPTLDLRLFVTAVVLSGTIAVTANGQTRRTTPTPKKAHPVTRPAQRKMAPLRNRARHPLPPPPPVGAGRSSARSSSRPSAGSLKSLFAGDPMGRVDLEGKPVPFYPSVRGFASKDQKSAIRSRSGKGKPRQNPMYKAQSN